MRRLAMLLAVTALAACQNQAVNNESNSVAAQTADPAGVSAELSLTRLDCGHAEFKDMNGFFSDRPGVYPPGPGKVTDSCYLIRHGDQQMVWDTGLPASTRDKPMVQGDMTGAIDRTIVEQLQQLGVQPTDIDVVGISHVHADHTGQAKDFPQARLVIGKADFDYTAGKDDPFTAWRGDGKRVTAENADIDVFGDGRVVALFLPGHTNGHHALLVKLNSGNVLLTGDLYHTEIARQKRAQPSWNDNAEQTLASMDKFEAIAKKLNAKVIIQHEPADISKLPAFPEAAK